MQVVGKLYFCVIISADMLICDLNPFYETLVITVASLGNVSDFVASLFQSLFSAPCPTCYMTCSLPTRGSTLQA